MTKGSTIESHLPKRHITKCITEVPGYEFDKITLDWNTNPVPYYRVLIIRRIVKGLAAKFAEGWEFDTERVEREEYISEKKRFGFEHAVISRNITRNVRGDDSHTYDFPYGGGRSVRLNFEGRQVPFFKSLDIYLKRPLNRCSSCGEFLNQATFCSWCHTVVPGWEFDEVTLYWTSDPVLNEHELILSRIVQDLPTKFAEGWEFDPEHEARDRFIADRDLRNGSETANWYLNKSKQRPYTGHRVDKWFDGRLVEVYLHVHASLKRRIK